MFIRYDYPNENDETRRERNDRHGVPSPEHCIPDGGETYWSWYFQISDGLTRVIDGVCMPVPASEINSWAQATYTIVTADEYAILRAMDTAFCDELNKELQAFHERSRKGNKDKPRAQPPG